MRSVRFSHTIGNERLDSLIDRRSSCITIADKFHPVAEVHVSSIIILCSRSAYEYPRKIARLIAGSVLGNESIYSDSRSNVYKYHSLKIKNKVFFLFKMIHTQWN